MPILAQIAIASILIAIPFAFFLSAFMSLGAAIAAGFAGALVLASFSKLTSRN